MEVEITELQINYLLTKHQKPWVFFETVDDFALMEDMLYKNQVKFY